jgi:hypothetical protein
VGEQLSPHTQIVLGIILSLILISMYAYADTHPQAKHTPPAYHQESCESPGELFAEPPNGAMCKRTSGWA